MSNWIKIDANLNTNKKFFALCEQLETTDHETMGLLVSFWSWCFENAKDGILNDIHVKSLRRALNCSDGKKLFGALVNCGFVDDDGDGNFFIHDWFEWAGSLHNHRKGNRERKRKERENKEVTATSQASVKMSRDRVEERRGEEIRKETPSRPAAQPGKKPRPRDETFDFVAQEFEIDPDVQGSRIGKLSSQFKKYLPGVAGWKEEIRRRRENYRTRWPNAADTPEALVKHWGAMNTSEGGAGDDYVTREITRIHAEERAEQARKAGVGGDLQILGGNRPEMVGAAG